MCVYLSLSLFVLGILTDNENPSLRTDARGAAFFASYNDLALLADFFN